MTRIGTDEEIVRVQLETRLICGAAWKELDFSPPISKPYPCLSVPSVVDFLPKS